jgi:hypothetical protein
MACSPSSCAPKLLHHVPWALSAALAFHAALAYGGMIGPEATLANEARSQADLDRANVRQFLNQATVKDKLQAPGVGALNAQERVDALSRGVPRRLRSGASTPVSHDATPQVVDGP